ncbi:MAG: DNA-binding protein [Actinomycetota bacterium]
MTAKKTTKKSTAKKTAKKVTAKKAATKKVAPKKAAAKAPAKKAAAKKATKKAAPAKKAPAKKSAAKTGSKSAAATKTAAPAATKKASKSSVKKATAKKNVAKSKTASAGSDAARVIPPEYDYLHDKKWLQGQREALIRERASYTTSADRLAAEAAALMADREPGDVQFDEESGEGDTIAVERDRDLALSAAARQSVAEIDAALERLDNNTYGMCEAGDDFIPRERLEAIPEASVCVQHKTSMF